MDDQVTLYHPLHGRPVTTDVRAEQLRLVAAGYTTTEPFQPDEHTVVEVEQHLKEDPEDAPRVVAVEKQGRRRATIVGHPTDDASGADSGDTGSSNT